MVTQEDASGNVCDLNGIASPDNVASVPEFNQLMIGEDTDGHVNDVRTPLFSCCVQKRKCLYDV